MIWQKTTVEILDYLLKELVNNNSIDIGSLKPLNELGFTKEKRPWINYIKNDNSSQFVYFANIIKDYNVANFVDNKLSKIPIITEDFLSQGGFTNIYEKQQAEISHENQIKQLTFEKLESDLKISKTQARLVKWSFIISILGISISALALMQKCNNGENKKCEDNCIKNKHVIKVDTVYSVSKILKNK
jgi:hypothetical protein